MDFEGVRDAALSFLSLCATRCCRGLGLGLGVVGWDFIFVEGRVFFWGLGVFLRVVEMVVFLAKEQPTFRVPSVFLTIVLGVADDGNPEVGFGGLPGGVILLILPSFKSRSSQYGDRRSTEANGLLEGVVSTVCFF